MPHKHAPHSHICHVQQRPIPRLTQGGGGYFGWGNFRGGISCFRLVPKCPLPELFLRNPGHFLLPGSVANICLLSGGAGARVLHVRISVHGGAYPQKSCWCASRASQRMICVPRAYPKRCFRVSAGYPKDCASRNCAQGTTIWGFGGAENSPPDMPPPPPTPRTCRGGGGLCRCCSRSQAVAVGAACIRAKARAMQCHAAAAPSRREGASRFAISRRAPSTASWDFRKARYVGVRVRCPVGRAVEAKQNRPDSLFRKGGS